jgi:hypothetical protein
MGTRSPDVPDTYLTGSDAVLAVTDVTTGLWKTQGNPRRLKPARFETIAARLEAAPFQKNAIDAFLQPLGSRFPVHSAMRAKLSRQSTKPGAPHVSIRAGVYVVDYVVGQQRDCAEPGYP